MTPSWGERSSRGLTGGYVAIVCGRPCGRSTVARHVAKRRGARRCGQEQREHPPGRACNLVHEDREEPSGGEIASDDPDHLFQKHADPRIELLKHRRGLLVVGSR